MSKVHATLISGAVLALLALPTAAAGTRTIYVQNKSTDMIDVGLVQPASSNTLEKYGNIHVNGELTFTLHEGEARMIVKSKSCFGSTSTVLPAQLKITAIVEKDCKTKLVR